MPTKIEEKKLYEKRNRDDIFVRDVLGGLLKVLNNKLVYDQVWDDTKEGVESITIPFYYEIGNASGERFLQDNYLTFGDQCGFKKINGNFDMIPRGMLSLESVQIESESVCNRYVMGEYQKEDPIDGKIKMFVAFLFSIPIKMTVNCEVRSSSFTEMLKISQACNEFFYKNKTYYINNKGMKLGCRVGFPDSFLGEKNSGYTMGGNDSAEKINLKQTFQLEIECYQPVFDKSTERLKSNYIRAWGNNLDVVNTVQELNAKTGEVKVQTTMQDDGFFHGAPYTFEYTLKIDSEEYAYYKQTGKLLDPHLIEQGIIDDGNLNLDWQSIGNGTHLDWNGGNLNGQIEGSGVIGNINLSGNASSSNVGGSQDTIFDTPMNQGNGYIQHSPSSDLFNLIYVIDDYKDWSLFPSGSVMKLRWQYRKHSADIQHIRIDFKEYAGVDKDEHFLRKEMETTNIALIPNHLDYDWYIPKDFTGFDGTDLIILNDDLITVYKEPIIKIIPDPKTGKITEDSIFCLDAGYFICPLKQELWDKKEENKHGTFSYFCHIKAELSYKCKNGVIKQMELILPIKDNKIETDVDNPNRINFKRVMSTPIDITYTDVIPYRVGDIVISDANNSRIYTTIPNVHIV